MYWTKATLYDYKCDIIGGKETVYSGLAIPSQLPNLVIIDSVNNIFGDVSVFGSDMPNTRSRGNPVSKENIDYEVSSPLFVGLKLIPSTVLTG